MKREILLIGALATALCSNMVLARDFDLAVVEDVTAAEQVDLVAVPAVSDGFLSVDDIGAGHELGYLADSFELSAIGAGDMVPDLLQPRQLPTAEGQYLSAKVTCAKVSTCKVTSRAIVQMAHFTGAKMEAGWRSEFTGP